MTKERILHLRKNLKVTQQELAVKLGVSISTVTRWERGQGEPSRLAEEKLQKLENKG